MLETQKIGNLNVLKGKKIEANVRSLTCKRQS